MQGLRNGFGRPQTAQYKQSFLMGDEGLLSYPNTLLDNGHHSPIPTSYRMDMPLGLEPVHDSLFETPTANGDRRRQSSAISPRTVKVSNHRTPHIPPLQPTNIQYPTSSESNSFLNHTPQEQLQNQAQLPPRPSLSTISSAPRTSTTSNYMGTQASRPIQDQQAIFALLSETCIEALRRKLYEQTERQLVRNIVSRHLHRQHQAFRNRYSPYPSLLAALHVSSSRMTQPMQSGQLVRFIGLMRQIANDMWENAVQQAQIMQEACDYDGPISSLHNPLAASAATQGAASVGEVETTAIDAMRTLYSLGSSIIAASEASARGQSFSLIEVKDIVGAAGRFCLFLGYREGAGRCDQARMGLLGAEEDGEGGAA